MIMSGVKRKDTRSGATSKLLEKFTFMLAQYYSSYAMCKVFYVSGCAETTCTRKYHPTSKF